MAREILSKMLNNNLGSYCCINDTLTLVREYNQISTNFSYIKVS
jgi:hypothetical protein